MIGDAGTFYCQIEAGKIAVDTRDTGQAGQRIGARFNHTLIARGIDDRAVVDGRAKLRHHRAMIDPRALETFLTVRREGSATAAARRLDISQPAVSVTIAQLDAVAPVARARVRR